LLLACTGALAGCDMVVLRPSGFVAAQQGQLVVISTLLMLLIIVPVIVMTLVFAWRYRESNTSAPYTPDWDHSVQLELLIWAAPLLIIIALGALTWIGTHTLDPYRSLSRIDRERQVPDSVEPLVVEVVALDWKWLFIYPDLDIAVVNELAAPVDAPIRFKITSSSVMNSFFIPALAGQIYATPSMETTLYAVINQPGEYEGFSANYSGAGFSGMRFKFLGMNAADFDRWVQKAKAGGKVLSRADYLQLEKPSERVPISRYRTVARDLFDAVVNRCVEQGKTCLRDMMAMDMHRGAAPPAARNSVPPDFLPDAAVCTVASAARSALLPLTYRD
jgi:cytochrome o ubiquinol oxidase subunit II